MGTTKQIIPADRFGLLEELQRKSIKKIKTIFGWALTNKKGGIQCYDAQMPIFWNKKIAKEENKGKENPYPIQRVKIIIQQIKK